MLDTSGVSLALLTIHRVGNKIRDEGVVAAKRLHPITEGMKAPLLNYFLTPFTSPEIFRFTHTSDVAFNEIYTSSQKLFADPKRLLPESVSALKHLYGCSEHPKIKAGELYFVYFTGIGFAGNAVDAIGIFKSETKDLFIKITEAAPGSLSIDIEQGANLKAPDKGCLILNSSSDEGYRVLVVDNANDGTKFWQEKFLNLVPVWDSHFYTNACMTACKRFSEDILVNEGEPKDQILFLQKSVEFFANNKSFDVANFSRRVFNEKAAAKRFQKYLEEYESKTGLPKLDSFTVSKPTVNKLKRRFKNFIRLDTQIEVKLKFENPESSNAYVERGFDRNRKMYFYKLYFNKEI